MSDNNHKISIFGAHRVRKHDGYSPHQPKESADSGEKVLHLPEDMLREREIVERKSINWKYFALLVSTLGALFLLIKVASVPVEPIIIMDEPAQVATSPAIPKVAAEQAPLSAPESASSPVPNEHTEMPPPLASSPAEAAVTKEVVTTDAAKDVNGVETVTADKPVPELTKIESAKQKAKQQAKQKSEAALQQKPIEAKSPVAPPLQQGIVVQPQVDHPLKNNEPQHAQAAEAKTAPAKEAAKPPAPEKSPWSKFADSITQGGEAPCSQAQIALNQCR